LLFGLFFWRGGRSGAAREAAAGSVESWSALGWRSSRRGREGNMVPDEGIEPPTFGLQNRVYGSDVADFSLFCKGR